MWGGDHRIRWTDGKLSLGGHILKKIIEKKKPEIHRGFVLLEIMGALVVVALVALLGAEKYSEYLDEQEWKVAATHVCLFNEASKQYIADHRDELLNQPLPYRITHLVTD